jgi:transposase-like protein
MNQQRGDATMGTAVPTSIIRNQQDRRSASEWRALMQAFSRSGQTRAQFCERHGLALSTFDRWRSQLRQEAPARVPKTSSSTEANALFVELAQEAKPVAVVSANWGVELDLGNGVFLRLRRGAC